MSAPTESTGMLIVGASQAGVQLAISLRGVGYDEHITLISDEDHRPYQRPALSKEYLQGTQDKERLIFRTAEYWEENDITVRQGVRVVHVDGNPDGSGVAVTATGENIAYRRLALAVGARARRLDVPGADLPGVLYLRNADDALALRATVDHIRDVVVIGGGFIGLEAASSLRNMGKNVTVVEAGPRLIGRAVGEETADYFLNAHRERGLNVLLNSAVSELRSERGRVSEAVLSDGTAIPAQLVLIGIGVIPNTELAEQMGLDVDNGIVVDRHALASDGTTVAVGDVANQPNPLPGADPDERIRLESVNNAIEHAKVAAYSLVGQRENYAGIPWFWSNQDNLKLQIAGLSNGFDQTVLRRGDDPDKFTLLYYRGGQIIAADCVNNPLDFMAVRTALGKNQNIPAEQAGDPTIALKSIAVELEAASS